MKTKRSVSRKSERGARLGRIALASVAALTVGSRARAASLYWDINGSTSGAGGSTPSGSWEQSNWNTSAAGTNSASFWSDGSTAVFAAGGDATGSYTVT